MTTAPFVLARKGSAQQDDRHPTGYRIVAFIDDEFVIELSKLDYIDQAAA